MRSPIRLVNTLWWGKLLDELDEEQREDLAIAKLDQLIEAQELAPCT